MILPCPFCGSYDTKVQEFGFCPSSKHDSWHVVCCECKAQTGWYDSQEAAWKAWERRVTYGEKR